MILHTGILYAIFLIKYNNNILPIDAASNYSICMDILLTLLSVKGYLLYFHAIKCEECMKGIESLEKGCETLDIC